jgi:hypothetical protein
LRGHGKREVRSAWSSNDEWNDVVDDDDDDDDGDVVAASLAARSVREVGGRWCSAATAASL